MNDWLDYQGSGSSRAYTNDTLSHASWSWFPTGSKQYDADDRLINAYAEKMKKLKSEYKILLNDYNRSIKSYYNNIRDAERNESIRAKGAKSGSALKATQIFEKNVWMYKKQASDAKNEADSYLTKMKVNVESQKKLREDVKSIDDSDYQFELERNWMRRKKALPLFIPDELPSNVSQRIKQSYFGMPANEFIMHAEKGGISMNDWLDYQGSGSSRAYTNDTLSHAAPVKKTTSNGYDYLNSRLSELTKQEDELVALAGEAANLMNTAYGKLRTAYGKFQIIDKKMATMDKAGWDITESINQGNLSAMQKEALTNKLNSIGKRGQAKLAAMYVPIDTVDDIRSSLRSALSNFTVVGHSYSGTSADEFIEHAFLGIESKKEREARLKDQKEKQSKAESALIDSQFDLARKYQTEYNQNKDKLTKAKKSADDLYSRYSETAAQLTKLEKQQREMSSSGVSQEVLRRNVSIIPQLRNKKEVLNDKYQEAYAKYTELRDRQKWLDDRLKSIVKYLDAYGHVEGYGK